VLEMTLAGCSTRQVAAELGVSHATVATDLHAALDSYAALQAEETAKLRALETARLDELLAGVYPKALAGNVRAFEAVLSIMNRRAKMLGLDLPVKVDISGEIDFHVEQILTVLERVLPREQYKMALEALAEAA
jgi:hypothetical protein